MLMGLNQSAEGRRKGTQNSCELALIECKSESQEEESITSSMIRKNLIASIREELIEYTDPNLYAEKIMKQQIQNLQTITSKEGEVQEDVFLQPDDLDKLLLDGEQLDQVADDDFMFQKNLYEHAQRRYTENRMMVFARPSQSPQEGEGENEEEKEAQQVKAAGSSIRKSGNLRIMIEKDSHSPQTQLRLCDGSNQQEEYKSENNTVNCLQSSNSCGKQMKSSSTFFQGIPMQTKTASNSPDRQLFPSKFKSQNIKNSLYLPGGSQSLQQIKQNSLANNMHPGQLGTGLFNQAIGLNQQKSDSVSQYNYRYEAMSPMSSNVGSFYYDRLEEFLPEKKLVAEKKLIRACTLFNPNYRHETRLSESISPTVSQMHTPVASKYHLSRQQWPYNRTAQASSASLVKSHFRQNKKSAEPREPTLFEKKIMLKESLTKYKDSKAEKKEKLKRHTAQALKFLRKLGRKLRKPMFKKVRINQPRMSNSIAPQESFLTNQQSFSPIKRTSPDNATGENGSSSPPKSCISCDDYSTRKKVSPRVQLLHHQQMLSLQKQTSCAEGGQLEKNGTNQQFCFHLTVAQDDNESAEFRKSKESTPKHSNNIDVKSKNIFAEMLANLNQKCGSDKELLPHFRDQPAFSFEASDVSGGQQANQNHPKRHHLPEAELKRKENNFHQLQIQKPESFMSLKGFDLTGGSDELSHQFSFSPDALQQAYNEIAQLQSPIVGRNQVQPELDEQEEFIMEALQEYREVETYKQFNNYQKYYEDAKQQNKAIEESKQKAQPVSQPSKSERKLSTFHPTNGNGIPQFNLGAFMGGEEFSAGRDRFQAVSFKSPRHFVTVENLKWQQDVHDLLLNNQTPAPQEEDEYLNLDTEEGGQDLQMERQVSTQDQNPWIDQSQPLAEASKEPSLHKSEKKSNISQASFKKLSNKLKNLALMIDQTQGTSIRQRSSRQSLQGFNGNGQGVMSQQYHDPEDGCERVNEQRATQECLSGDRERGHIRLSSDSRSGNNDKELLIRFVSNDLSTQKKLGNDTNQNTLSPRLRSRKDIFHNKPALKKLNNNLKNLYDHLMRSPSPVEASEKEITGHYTQLMKQQYNHKLNRTSPKMSQLLYPNPVNTHNSYAPNMSFQAYAHHDEEEDLRVAKHFGMNGAGLGGSFKKQRQQPKQRQNQVVQGGVPSNHIQHNQPSQLCANIGFRSSFKVKECIKSANSNDTPQVAQYYHASTNPSGGKQNNQVFKWK